MEELEIARIDVFDDASVDAWWGVYAAAERADRGAEIPVWSLRESRFELQQSTQTIQRRAYLARRGGAVVASAKLALPQRDNLRSAGVAVHVAPEHRRRGIGSAVLAHLEAVARAEGRSIFDAEVSWPYADGAHGEHSPGCGFARAHGYALALGDVQSRLPLPVDAASLNELDAASRSAAHTVHTWAGPVPEEFLAGWAALEASVETEAPTGEREIEAATADPAAVREEESLLVQQNRTSFGAVAVDASGDVVAYTQIVVSGDDGNAYQWGTLVRRDARGHRLGTALKVANLRTLMAHSPHTSQVLTYNAGVNEHMLRINRALGFAPSERMGEFQKLA